MLFSCERDLIMYAITYNDEKGSHVAPYLFEHYKDAIQYAKKITEHLREIYMDYRGFEARKLEIEASNNVIAELNETVPHTVGYNLVSYQHSNYGHILAYVDLKYMYTETFKDADKIGYSFL